MKKLIFLYSVVLLILFSNCQTMKQKADLLIYNGKIYTLDSISSMAEAMAVKDGKIIALGTREEIQKKYQGEEQMDVMGKAIFPGFIDAHCHFYGMAQNLQYVDLTGSQSFEEVLFRLNSFQLVLEDGWIVGRGWDQNLWEKKEFPNRQMLDKAYPDRPVMLIRVDGHTVLANQLALKKAGIGMNNSFRPGEVGIRNGILSGILSEKAADLMRNTVPIPDKQGMKNLLMKAQELCFSCGLTGVSDAGLEFPVVKLLDSLQQQGVLKIHVYAMLSPSPENINEYVLKGIYRTDQLSVSSIKLYADGSLGSRTALMKQPYSDAAGGKGILVTSPDSIKKYCQIALASHYQVNTHCIGDSAVKLVLEIYGSMLKGKNDHRWRIEHAQVVDPADIGLFGKFSVIPSVQCTHATSDMLWAEKRIGKERIRGAYAYKALLRENGWLPNGTDFPIEQISPLLTFYAAVARKDLKGYPEKGFQTENAISREEALKSITIWAARANFDDRIMGSLEVGKQANLVILDKDIMTIPIMDVPKTRVLKTIIRGEVMYAQ